MLNEKIKSLRKQKGFTQEEVAIRLNVVRQTISKWEKGLSVPDADMIIKISDLFEISTSELLDGNFQSNVNEINEKQYRKPRNNGLGFTSTLTLILAVLKILNLISISWVWVVSPIWISILLIALLFLGFYLITKAKGKW